MHILSRSRSNRDVTVAESIAQLMIHDPRFNGTSDDIDCIYVGARYHTSYRQARKRKYNIEQHKANMNHNELAFDELTSQLNDGLRSALTSLVPDTYNIPY